MRAFNLENPVDAEKIVGAVAEEIKAYAKEHGGVQGGVLCIQVRKYTEEQKDSETAPRREMQSR